MKFSRKILSAALSVAMVMGLSVPAYAAEMDGKVVVLHTNDIHGYYETTEEGMGLAGVVGLKEYYENLGAEVLLLDAGDFSQGQTLVNHFKGVNAAEYLALAGYDAVALGNHEFDFGYDNLLKTVDALGGIPVLNANLLKKGTDEPAFGDSVIFEVAGLKIGVFGLNTAETQTKSSPSSVKDVTFLDMQEMFDVAQAQVDALTEAGSDYIICLAHLGVDAESIGRRSTDLANAVTGMDLIIDGHSHTEMNGGELVNGSLIVSTGSYLANAGVVEIDVATKETVAKLISAAEYAESIGVYDEAINAAIAKDRVVVDAYYAGVFATTLVDLNGERDPGVRTEETNLGNFSADAFLYVGQKYAEAEDLGISVDVAISNGGGIRASIPTGEISMNTLYTVFPYGNTVVLATITGEQLLEVIEASVFCTPVAVGGFPQVAGMEFTLDVSVEYANGEQYPNSTYYAPANPGSRVTITSVGGEAFDLSANYTVVVNSFLAEGGDTYYTMTEASYVQDMGIIDAEALIMYVDSLGGTIGVEYAEPQGRMTIVGEAAPVEAAPVETAPVVEEPIAISTELYKVVAGDNLWKIAESQLGDGLKWRQIYNDNKEQISNPALIYIGQELVVKEK